MLSTAVGLVFWTIVGSWGREVDIGLATINVLILLGSKGSSSGGRAGELNVSESLGASTLTIGDDVCTGDLSELLELTVQPLVIDVPAQVTNEQVLASIVIDGLGLGLLGGCDGLVFGLALLGWSFSLSGRVIRIGSRAGVGPRSVGFIVRAVGARLVIRLLVHGLESRGLKRGRWRTHSSLSNCLGSTIGSTLYSLNNLLSNGGWCSLLIRIGLVGRFFAVGSGSSRLCRNGVRIRFLGGGIGALGLGFLRGRGGRGRIYLFLGSLAVGLAIGFAVQDRLCDLGLGLGRVFIRVGFTCGGGGGLLLLIFAVALGLGRGWRRRRGLFDGLAALLAIDLGGSVFGDLLGLGSRSLRWFSDRRVFDC